MTRKESKTGRSTIQLPLLKLESEKTSFVSFGETLDVKSKEVMIALHRARRTNYGLEDFQWPKGDNEEELAEAALEKLDELRSTQGFIHMEGTFAIERANDKIQLSYDHPVNAFLANNQRIRFRCLLDSEPLSPFGRRLLMPGSTSRLILYGCIDAFFDEPLLGPNECQAKQSTLRIIPLIMYRD